MCDDKNNLTKNELILIGVFKEFYWPNQSPCNQIQALAHRFPGANINPTEFNEALCSLINRGCITTRDNLSYCLTKCGIQAIGAAPQNDNV